ncbi:L-rhamnose mutarotase [Psychromarinibacter halotolerans]|uniref:L-rhamnose mutarotase n=1 Tax=Psychromarinibacter halotolerans TaxID=1775175 RepID=A0ABV7GS32_9RHOB|nr:L-rhamnose mutarotase [Psychromarinibacter halotolerans]MDF0595275.1 L-rhamnose mutarotase [Psychromarinibacter halotolerans]
MSWEALTGTGFVLRLRPGMAGEYRRRHAEIWPDMAKALRASGVVVYEIFLDEAGGQVFGHMLRDGPPPETEDPVILRWRAYMADVLEMDGDQPLRVPVEKVFRLTAAGGAGGQSSSSP